MSRSPRHASTVPAALVAAACLLGSAGAAAAQTEAPGGELPQKSAIPASGERAAPQGQLYYWYDGDQRRAVGIDPSRVADFRPGAAQQGSGPEPSNTTAQGSATGAGQGTASAPGQGTASAPGQGAEGQVAKSQRRGPLRAARATEKSANAHDLPPGVSPVLRDADAPASVRALPGGVILTLMAAPAGTDPAARDAAVRKQLEEAGLEPVRAIDPAGQVWLVASPAGLESLELANRLHESGAFRSVTPNWWQPRALK